MEVKFIHPLLAGNVFKRSYNSTLVEIPKYSGSRSSLTTPGWSQEVWVLNNGPFKIESLDETSPSIPWGV